MYNESKIIIKYHVPDLGDYAIDEDMTIFCNQRVIVNCQNLIDAKENLSKTISSDREKKISNLRKIINNLELQNTDIEVYKQKKNFI